MWKRRMVPNANFNSNSSKYFHIFTAKMEKSSREGPNLEESPEISHNHKNLPQHQKHTKNDQKTKEKAEETNSIVESPRILLEPNQEEFLQKIDQQIVEPELTSTNPTNWPSTSEKAETSNSTTVAEGPSPSFGSLETARELGEEKATKIEENINQEQNWQKEQNEIMAQNGNSLSHLQHKKTGQTTNWLAEMFGGGICQSLFGSNPSSSSEVRDAQNPLEKKDGNEEEKDKREKQRIVRANDRAYNAQFEYADNFIRTSKYTLLTFIPYNLYQQFTRIANFYFLVLLFLQCIPQIASVHWMYTLFPLSFVLMCSAIKEGFDDLQRHRNDRQVNMRITYVIRNNRRLAVEEWMDVKVGDIIRMDNESFIAADLLLLSSSEPHGLCYIETAELDGETNLKTRVALSETEPLGDYLKEMSEFDGKVICEPPNNRLDHFEGRLEWKGKVIPLDNKNMLLRGCRLRNTRWCYGLVVFAGKDTKLMKNSGESPMKRTSLDKFLNLLILGIVLFLLAMCLICTFMTGFWEHIVGRHFRVFLPWDDAVPHMKNFTIIQLSLMSKSEKEEEERTIAPSQVFFIAALQFFSYVIVLNTVVPISLYISVEMIRLAHSKFINNDLKMYDEKTDTPARARTSTLNEELGQVQYVFSDKTGTLTQNVMLFKKCSINGRSYGDLMTERGELLEIDEKTTPTLDFSKNRWYEPNFRFYDKALMEDTKRGLKEVHEFWRLLAICHTVMPERKPGNVLEYQAQSPDEAALTSAARNFGFVFKSRTPQTITVEVDGKEEVYEMLHILDFDNVRKRMSVLIRCKNGKIKLYCKGADTMIMERVSPRETNELLKSATNQHLDKFATDGLRTLCVAYKNIEPEYCEQWMRRLKEARLDKANKEKRVDALYEEMEKDMILLGATAIDDKLQDDVPQTIATLAAANIKLWVLTGDKTETAINIGYSCQLLTENMREVFIIDGKDEKEVEVQLKDIKRRIQCAEIPKSTVGASDFYLPPRTPIRELSPSRLESPHGHGGPSKSPQFEQTTTFPPNGLINLLNVENGCGVRFSTPPMDGGENCQTRNGAEEFVGAEDGGYALVINGDSLVHALKRKYEKTFLEIGCSCASVICCRVTPLQKAQVVDLVKRNIKAVTLAIGDGANDVSMIRTAHIGVGISGQEGMQAVLSSDFSIAQFRYLERLLLVHGRWSYLRMCKFLRYFFYKNFAYTLTHFWYSFFCGFSAQTVFDPFLISLYNLCFTALPILFMGIFDQDVSDTYSIRFPRLYIPGQFNLFFNMRIFIYSIIHGMISSLVLFFVPFGALFHAINADGRDMNDYSMLAFTCFTALVLVVNGQIAFDITYWSWWNWFVVFGSLCFYFLVVIIIYELLPISWLYPYVAFSNVGVVGRATSNFSFWLSLLLICAILLLPVLGNRFFWFDTHPSYANRLRVRHRLYGEDEAEARGPSAKQAPARTAMTRCQRRGSLRSGYAFSHSSGFGELIAKGTLFKNLENLRIPSFHRDQHLSDKIHPIKDHSPIRRFSLLKAPSTLLPSILHPHHHSDSNPSPTSLIPPSNEGNGCTSVTQFSPGSSNATTTTTLPANQQIGNDQKQKLHSNIVNLPNHNRGRRGTVDSLIIEHPPVEIVNDSLITQIPVNQEEENQIEMGRVSANSAILVPLRMPSPDLRNTAHNLVINADLDEEKPLPSNWQYNPADGTLFIPELEQPPQAGTTINGRGNSTTIKKTFISKKRRDITHSDSIGSNESSTSSSGNLQRQQTPILAKPPPKPQRVNHQNRPETKHGIFKGKLRKTSSELEENGAIVVEREKRKAATGKEEDRERRTEKAKEKKKTSFGVEKERRPRK